MFGLTEVPDTAWVDREIGRKPGDYGGSEISFLLNQGFQVYQISDYDPHAFVARGLDYLKEQHGTSWNRKLATHWTPKRIKLSQRKAAQDLQHRAPYRRAGKYFKEQREPTFEDIRTLLADGWVVDITVGMREAAIKGVALVCDINERGHPLVYEPRQKPPTVTSWANFPFMDEWLPTAGIAAYRLQS